MTTVAAADDGLPPLDAFDADDDATQLDIKPPEFEPPQGPAPQGPPALRVEAPPQTVPATLPATSVAPPTTETRLPLDQIWPEPPRKREIPAKLKLGLGAAALLLAIIVALGSRGTPPPPAAAVSIDDEMVVSAEDLKDRREVRADDFRPKRQFLEIAPRTTSRDAEPAVNDLAERRARRDADPEDLLTLRKSGRAASSGREPAKVDEPLFDGPVYVGVAQDDASVRGPAGRPPALLAAGTTLPGVLVNPLELRGDSATVLVRVDKNGAVPSGTRFVGVATVSGSRVTMRFRSLLLPDGRQVRVEAEAQDEEGAFGLRVTVEETRENAAGTSASDIAKDAASEVLISAIGSDIAGRAADRYLRSSRGGRPVRERSPVNLAAGTRLQVFVHDVSEP
jgi:hypothetical protein